MLLDKDVEQALTTIATQYNYDGMEEEASIIRAYIACLQAELAEAKEDYKDCYQELNTASERADKAEKELAAQTKEVEVQRNREELAQQNMVLLGQIATLTAELGPAKACANNLAQNVSVLEQQLGETIKTISTIRKAATKSREIYKEKGAGSAYLFLATIAADPEITPEDLERTENLIEGIDRARAEIAKENTDAE